MKIQQLCDDILKVFCFFPPQQFGHGEENVFESLITYWDKGWNWCQESWTSEAGRAQDKESSGMGTVY